MKILVIGATGTIGGAVVSALGERHEVVSAARSSGVRIDIEDPGSIREGLLGLLDLDAIVCCAGNARFAPLAKLSEEDFAFSIGSKLMGQVHVIRNGLERLEDGGSITVTSGVLAQHPMPGSAAVSLVNAGLEGFVRAAAGEAPRGIRVNVVSPPWVKETMVAMGMDPSPGKSAAEVAKAYVRAVEGGETGATIAA